MNTLTSKYAPGTRVILEKVISGVVECVEWHRGMSSPMYLVDYWCNGEMRSVTVHENSLTLDDTA